jgi:hypothetical protein
VVHPHLRNQQQPGIDQHQLAPVCHQQPGTDQHELAHLHNEQQPDTDQHIKVLIFIINHIQGVQININQLISVINIQAHINIKKIISVINNIQVQINII